jgi:AcrR family transcriptional regulator
MSEAGNLQSGKPLSRAGASRRGGGASKSPPKSGGDAKFRQILDGARRIFLADGFDGASMNDIARAAGVSKGTLYVYFPSKLGLFEALIRFDRAQQAEQLFRFGGEADDIGEVLTRIGIGLMRNMCRADHLAHMRMVIGAVAKYPEIGRAFYEAGPKAGAERIGEYLAGQMAQGRIAPVDPPLAADQFLQLCQTGYFKAALFRTATPDDDAAIRAAVENAVAAFLRICRLDPAAKPRTAG